MGMVTDRANRISVVDLTRALSSGAIGMDEFIRRIEESYSFNNQIKAIANPSRNTLFVAYENNFHPTLHQKLTAAGWESNGIVVDERQTSESVERTEQLRTATYNLDSSQKRRMVIRR